MMAGLLRIGEILKSPYAFYGNRIETKGIMRRGVQVDETTRELERLQKKIERYREALSAIKAEVQEEDSQIQGRLTRVEQRLKRLEKDVQEFVQLIEESLNYMRNEVMIRKENTLLVQTENYEQEKTQQSIQTPTIPTFNNLRTLAGRPAQSEIRGKKRTPLFQMSAPLNAESKESDIEGDRENDSESPSIERMPNTAYRPLENERFSEPTFWNRFKKK